MPVRDLLSAASGASGPATYIEDVFSTYLTTGASANITVNNGIDLAGKGGLVWQKPRNSAGYHTLFDTARGANYYLFSNTTNAQGFSSNILPTFNSNGFVIGTDNNLTTSGTTGVSWTFRKQPKFFDVVTYTGTGSPTTISHSLGSVPGMIIVKETSGTTPWVVYHQSIGNDKYLNLDTTGQAQYNDFWNNTSPTASNFSVNNTFVNASGATYVAYLFANNAGGFGLAGTDNVISCGSWTATDSGDYTVNLGYEPQYLLIKRTDTTGNWIVVDNMRGLNNCSANTGIGATASPLFPNLSNAESSGQYIGITATGFNAAFSGTGSRSFIYMAIRRPMKVPTDATTVYKPVYVASSPSDYDVTFTGLSYVDHIISWKDASSNGYNAPLWNDRLRGFPVNMAATTWANNPGLTSALTDAEATGVYPPTTGTSAGYGANYLSGVTMNRAVWGGGWTGYTGVFHGLKRAAGFFDVVCWGGSGANVNHNLGVAPQLIFYKSRSQNGYWGVYCSLNSNPLDSYLFLQTTGALEYAGQAVWQNMTSTTFGMTAYIDLNVNAVAYLFATCPGVSKVGTYTGTSFNQTINCGFTGGARFVLIKRTDSTGDWYVWNTASGMVSGTDQKLKLNSNAAQTNADWVVTTTGGFQIVTPDASVNYSGGTYIYLAIA